MSKRWYWFVGTAVAILVGWLALPPADETPDEGDEQVEAAAAEPPAEDLSAEQLPPPPAVDDMSAQAIIARLGRSITVRQARAEADETDWLTLEFVADAYALRARLTGNWQDYASAQATLDQAFDRAIEGSGPHMSQASLHYTLHRLDAVEPILTRVENMAIPQADRLRSAAAMRANLALQRGRYEDAERAFEALLEQRRSSDAVFGLAQVRWQTGADDEARTLLEEAETLQSGADHVTQASMALARGLLELDTDNLDAALAHYQRGLELVPGWYLLEEHVAEIVALKGHHDRALTMYDELIERTGDPEFMDAAAGIHEEQGRDEEAAAFRDRAHRAHEERIERFPEAAFGHALDHFIEHAGDAERAVELAEQNRDARPNGKSWTDLARAYHHAGRQEDAESALSTVRATPYRSGDLDEVAALIEGGS